MQGYKFAIGITDGEMRGIATIGRPVARHLDDGLTCEVTRCCTDGVKNGCSMLYGAAWRAAKAMGYTKIITYTLDSEIGASLRAVGWLPVHGVGGTPWSNSTRKRNANPNSDGVLKTRWETQA